MDNLTTWTAFLLTKGAAFDKPGTWRCMACAITVSICMAVYTQIGIYGVSISKIDLFVHRLSTFLNVFVGFLLGFFLSSSMLRWYSCTNAFLQLLDSVRSMQMQMIALGVDRVRREMLSRYGILSAWLLHFSLSAQQGGAESQVSESAQLEKTWMWLEQARPNLVLPEEKRRLLRHQECYALLWTWVASLVGRMAQDGEIPPMASPTYGRILEIVEAAYGSIRDVRSLQKVRPPFVYVHTLAVLVHVNHILNAISFGLVVGMTTQAAMGKADRNLRSDLPRLVSSLFMAFCMSMVAPFLYLALLDVCVCISQPFTYVEGKIPALKFIRNLEEDIINAAVMADNTKWEKPRFKK